MDLWSVLFDVLIRRKPGADCLSGTRIDDRTDAVKRKSIDDAYYASRVFVMIVIRLRYAMKVHSAKYDTKYTYETLSERTGVSASTLAAIGNREGYNTTIETLDKICRVLKTTPPEILLYDPTKTQTSATSAGSRKGKLDPRPKRKRKSTKKGG